MLIDSKLIPENVEFSELTSTKHKIICGDISTKAPLIPKSSVQSIITSPPYWGLRFYGAENEIGGEATLEAYINSLSNIFNSLKDALREDGTMWIVIGDAYTSGNRNYRDTDKKHSHRGMATRPQTPQGLKPKDLIGLAWRLAFRLQADGWYLRSEVIWHKSNPIPESVKDRPHQSHEHIFLLSKSEKYKFDWEAIRELDNERLRSSRSVWTVPVNTGITGHAAPFPIDLIKPCISASTQPGDLVLDPFAGSGSVGVACKILDRAFLGIELIEGNVEIANKRLRLTCAEGLESEKKLKAYSKKSRLSTELAQELGVKNQDIMNI